MKNIIYMLAIVIASVYASQLPPQVEIQNEIIKNPIENTGYKGFKRSKSYTQSNLIGKRYL